MSSKISRQAAIILTVIEQEIPARPAAIVQWAGSVLAELDENVPGWLIDVSMQTSQDVADFAPDLRQGAQGSLLLPTHLTAQVIIAALAAGVLSFGACLSKLFRVVILDGDGAIAGSPDEPLADALVEWDCQDDLDVIDPPLLQRFESIFASYLVDAGEVAKLLRPVFRDLTR